MNGIEDTDITSHIYSHLVSRMMKKKYIGEKSISLANAAGKTGYSLVEEWNLILSLILHKG